MGSRLLGTCLLSVCVLTMSVSCDARKQPSDGITSFEKDDAGMNSAISQARSTVDHFITRLNAPVTDDDMVSVKIAMATTDGSFEHIWCDGVVFREGTFTANIANEPRDKQYVYGQQVTAKSGEISDWMFVENRKLVGGYTVRYMYSQMSATEKADFLRAVPFALE